MDHSSNGSHCSGIIVGMAEGAVVDAEGAADALPLNPSKHSMSWSNIDIFT